MAGRVAGVVLAAGFSRRLGEPKQLVQVGGETLLERAVRVALEAGLRPVFAVVQAELAGVVLRDADVLVNGAASEGMAASIRLGVTAAEERGAAGVVVMTCDQVGVTAEHLRALMRVPGEVAASGYAGRRGVPAYFPASAFEELMELRGDAGARELLREARVVVDERLGLDVDTPEDLERARVVLGA